MLSSAFNGDSYISNTFLNLKNVFNIDTVVETGTYRGDTTIFLCEHFKNVYSIEVRRDNYEFALNKLRFLKLSPNLIWGKSEDVLKSIIVNNKITDRSIFFLDAHWYECPLQRELEIIAECNIKPIIVIHDFVVPYSKTLGYDEYNDQPFTYEWLKPYFDRIYGVGKYNYWYNSDIFSGGRKRGVIYLSPSI